MILFLFHFLFFFFCSASFIGLRVTTDKPYLTNFMYDNNAVEPDFETEMAENVTSNATTNDVVAVDDKSSGLCFQSCEISLAF